MERGFAMRPRERRETSEQDLFRSRLDQIIDMNHALVKLTRTIDWRFLEAKFGAVYTDKPGQPPLPTRLMAGLAILKHTYDLSDEALCDRWVENPYFQYFCGASAHRQRARPLHHRCWLSRPQRPARSQVRGLHDRPEAPPHAADQARVQRRAAIEPVIGHLKEHHRMGLNHLAHAGGDDINAVLAAAGYNFRRLLAWLRFLLLRILIALGLAAQFKLA
jgi:transposase-like protein DUF772